MDSFPLATPRNEITLFNSLFAYITHGALEGNIAGLSVHGNRVWDACSLLISLDWIKVFLISLGDGIYRVSTVFTCFVPEGC